MGLLCLNLYSNAIYSLMKRQLAFLIARAQIPVEWLHPPSADDEEAEEVEFETDLQDCLYNTKLSQHFRDFGKEVGVEDAKSLEDVYKSHLENTSKHLVESRLWPFV